jgi:hypothetical protein
MIQLRDIEFEPVRLPELIGVALFAAYCLGFGVFSDEKWVPLLDSANLALHEAGHPLFGVFGRTAMWYGGTLMQLVFPVATVLAFLGKQQAHGVVFGAVWIGNNLLNIGRYMADARAQMLPLAGGGEHDWTEIFARWGVLQHDTVIGGGFRFVGGMLIVVSVMWLVKLWRDDRERPNTRALLS